MSKRIAVDPKATVTVADYLTIERLVRERPSVSNLEKSAQLFPSCAIFWSTYLDYLIETPEKGLKVAERAVAVCPHIDLWKRYLALAKSVSRLPDFFPIYEKAISEIGNDSKSTDFWIEYLYILRALFNTQILVQNECLDNPSNLPPNAFLVPLSPIPPAGLTEDILDVEGFKQMTLKPTVTSMREVFQSALSVPMERIDAIWDDYQAYEQVVANAMVAMAQNAPTIGGLPPPQLMAGVQASKLLSEYSNRWIQSKQGLKELTRIYAPINLYFSPIPLDATTAETVKANVIGWRRVVAFEKTNPFKLGYVKFQARLAHVFKLCMMSNVYVAEFWVEMFVWTLADRGPEAALQVLEKGVKEYLVHDVLLRLIIAYLLEETGQTDKAFAAYSESLTHYTQFAKPTPSVLMHWIRFACRSFSGLQGRNLFLQHLQSGSIHVDYRLVIAFAKLELRMMNNTAGALKVLEMGLIRFAKLAVAKTEIEKLIAQIKSDVLGVALGDRSAPILAKSFDDAQRSLQLYKLGFGGVEAAPTNEEVVDLVGSDAAAGGLKRPDVSLMHSFKPSMEEPAVEKFKLAKPLKSLVELLPVSTTSALPNTDALLKMLQTVDLPPVAVGNVKRLEEDPHLEQLRRDRDDHAVQSQGANLKRLLVGGEDKKDDDVIIKSDLMDQEREQRDFLSALASNIHRERVYYKRHKLISLPIT